MNNLVRAARVFALCCCSFSLAAVQAEQPDELRIVSYNIHHGEGVDRKLDLQRIAGVIESVHPDIVALQEVDKNVQRTQSVDQPAELARLTKMQVVFAGNISLGGGQYGNAVLSKWPVIEHVNHPLPNDARGEQRGVLQAYIQTPGSEQRLMLLATHLDHRPSESLRLQSAEMINALVAKEPQNAAILAGDLNAVPDSRTLQTLKTHWTDSFPKSLATIPVSNPVKQIDYVLYRPNNRWQVVQTRVLDEAIASDHRAILSVLRLMPDDSTNQ